jgi:Tol biopolymer transport system component
MTRGFAIGIIVAALGAGAMLHAQSTRSAEAQLKAAQQKAEVEGDLKGAIEAYKKIVASAGGNRAVAAEALVRMAECYQKLGDAESKKIYERIVREFADQKDAVVVARARLAGPPSVARATGDRAVWKDGFVDLFGQVSPDGRFITYVDWPSSGNLMVHDIATNTDRRITQKTSWKESGEAEFSTISRDGKLVAYAWRDWGPGIPPRPTIRIAPLQDAGRVSIRQVLEAKSDIDFIYPYDWSPDNKWLAVVAENRKEGTFQIGVVAVADGAFRVLKTVTWPGPTKVFFAGDSRYIAYDLRASDDSDQRDILALAIDGSRETALIVHPAQDKALGWSPDGTRLLFASDRTGSMGLWSQRVVDGRPVGAPTLLKSDIGSSIFPLGVTSSGALYVYKTMGDRDIRIASIDVNAETLGPARSFVQGFLPRVADPDWSPDGKYLVYEACDNRECLAIRSVETGQVRRLPAKIGYVRAPRWSPDGRTILCAGRDFMGRWGVFRVDAQTGETTILVSTGNIATLWVQWSPAGDKIYYTQVGDHPVVLERDLASEKERVVARPVYAGPIELSPDGRFLASATLDVTTNTYTFVLMPVDGGEARELFRSAPRPSGSRQFAWTPDGQAIIVANATGAHPELWVVPISSGQPRKLNIDFEPWALPDVGGTPGGFSFSRDGKRIAFLTGNSRAEVWALENFLPALKASR